MREMWLAVLVVLGLAGVGPAAAQPAKPDSALALTDQDRVLGSADAPITIVEYASLTCPHCAHFTMTVLPKLKEKWFDTGKAKLVLRDFPLDETALRAAMVARCAPPERFYPMVDSLFSTQDKWVLAKDWRAALEKIVKFAGVGPKEFDACLANTAVENQVAQSRLTAAQVLGVELDADLLYQRQEIRGRPDL